MTKTITRVKVCKRRFKGVEVPGQEIHTRLQISFTFQELGDMLAERGLVPEDWVNYTIAVRGHTCKASNQTGATFILNGYSLPPTCQKPT